MSKKDDELQVIERQRYIDELILEVQNDFEKRRKERLPYERQWELNMKFLAGNQYCGINGLGELMVENKTFYWQNREVYNHIAPIMESRLAKLSKVVPSVSVRPKTDDDQDVANALNAEKLLSTTFKKCDLENVLRKVNNWSETCGTGFYKVVWNNAGGQVLGELEGQKIHEGEVEILAVSPFEIFPDNLNLENIKDCQSIIHAKVVPVSQIYEKYGVIVEGNETDVYKFSGVESGSNSKSAMHDSCTVIERYERASTKYPNGRLVTIAGGKLLYCGELPYKNGNNESRIFPFVKQVSVNVVGKFFGVSLIERLIPIQRAFNAVKNRKHEFMNRLTMGIMKVEDGSVDVDDLAEDGLSPGKILVYRQGSKAPEIMANMSMPSDFTEEEEKLANEFVVVSGVSDVSSSSKNANLSSGSALSLLIEQDNARMVVTADAIRSAILEIARQSIKLYAQFTAGLKAVKYVDKNNKIKIVYAGKDVFDSDDVYLESENELLYTNTQKKEMVFRLFDSGLLFDRNGSLRAQTKEKVLSLLGYKDLDYQRGLSRLQEERAINENLLIRKEDKEIEIIDDDEIHIDEHVRYVLSETSTLNEQEKQRFYKHIDAHKKRLNKE